MQLFSFLIRFPIIKKYKNSKIRQMMRGYRVLKKTGRLDRIKLLNLSLTSDLLAFKFNRHTELFFGSGSFVKEKILRQYLFYRLGGYKLNQVLLRSLANNKSIVYPMPPEWRDVLEKHGFLINKYFCAVTWQLYIVLNWLYGIFTFVKVACENVKLNFDDDYLKKYVSFVGISKNNLPANNAPKNYSIVSWYIAWSEKVEQLNSIYHNVPQQPLISIDGIDVKYKSSFFPKITNKKAQLDFYYLSLKAIFKSFIDFFFGHWINAYMLNQCIRAFQVKKIESELLAEEYLFHNSDWLYRPLWTYEAEAKNAKVTIYFYSTNCEPLKQYKSDIFLTDYSGMTWSSYIVWDTYQANFLEKSIGSPINYRIAGPIWFSDSSNYEVPEIAINSILVFDVEPFRDSRYRAFCLDFEYYIPSIAKQFLIDIYDVANQLNLDIIFKAKRNKGRYGSRTYSHIIQKLKNKKNFISVSPDISPMRLIEDSNIVISAPFTSTAHIARNYGIPAAYYDPTGMLEKDNSASHGIELILGKDELLVWIKMNMMNNLK